MFHWAHSLFVQSLSTQVVFVIVDNFLQHDDLSSQFFFLSLFNTSTLIQQQQQKINNLKSVCMSVVCVYDDARMCMWYTLCLLPRSFLCKVLNWQAIAHMSKSSTHMKYTNATAYIIRSFIRSFSHSFTFDFVFYLFVYSLAVVCVSARACILFNNFC